MKLRFYAMGLLCLVAAASYAQTMEKDTFNLEEVTVTSRYVRPTAVSKLPVPLNRAPLSVSRVEKEKIENLAMNSLVDVTRNMTGIRPNNSYGGFQYFVIRGFSDFVLLNDGIRDERHNLWQSAPNTSLASIQSVEVLKGAASVMFGHSALGGVINLIHKQPTAASHVNAQLGIGSWGRYKVQAGAGGSISNRVQFRTDFSMSGGEGWRHTDDKAYNAYFALLFNLSDRDKLNFSVSAKNDHYGTDTGQPHFTSDIYDAAGKKVYEKGDIPEYISRRTRYADPLDHLDDKDITFSLAWNHEFKNPDWTLSDHASYYADDLDYYASEGLSYLTSSDPIYSHYYMNGDTKTYISLDSIQRTGFNFAYKVHLFQNQLEVNGKAKTGAIKHDLLFGYNFSAMDAPRYRNYYGSDAKGPGKNAHLSVVNPVLNQGNIESPFSKLYQLQEYNHGVYVGDYLHFTPKFTGLVSLRYDHFNRSYRENDTHDKTIVNKGSKTHLHYNALTYRLSLLYQFTKDFNVYASTSNFYKPTRTSAADGYIYIGSDGKQINAHGANVFKPISGYQYEIGSHLGFSSRLIANIAAFYIMKKNMVQSLGKLEDGTNVSGQVGKADSKGIEVDLFAMPTYGWTIDAGYTLTIAKVRDYAKNQYAGNTQAGNYLTHAPKHMAYGWMFYEFNNGPLNGFKVGAGFNSSSKVYVNAANTMTFDGYTIANAMASYRFKNWKLQLNVNNLFDKTYYMTAVNTTGYIPEQGRNFQFTASFDL